MGVDCRRHKQLDSATEKFGRIMGRVNKIKEKRFGNHSLISINHDYPELYLRFNCLLKTRETLTIIWSAKFLL